MLPLQIFAPGRQVLQAMRALLQPSVQVCLSRCSPAAVHSRSTSALHQVVDGWQPLHSPVAALQPEVQGVLVVSVPSALQATWFAPLQVRLLGLHWLHARRTGSHPCAHIVLVSSPLGSQICRTLPAQVRDGGAAAAGRLLGVERAVGIEARDRSAGAAGRGAPGRTGPGVAAGPCASGPALPPRRAAGAVRQLPGAAGTCWARGGSRPRAEQRPGGEKSCVFSWRYGSQMICCGHPNAVT